MLIRQRKDEVAECIPQEHHALLSGVLASAWRPTRLEPLLVQAIGLHDNPWRSVDRAPLWNSETRLPHDFISYPVSEKADFYRSGLDELEEVHPYIAFLVSKHYTTFSGTRNYEPLTEPESRRRRRLGSVVSDKLLDRAERDLQWMKFFDVLSLYVCLTGPQSVSEAVPSWLEPVEHWSEAPDGTALELEWRDDETLEVAPWPFGESPLSFDVRHRPLEKPFETSDELNERWAELGWSKRCVTVADA